MDLSSSRRRTSVYSLGLLLPLSVKCVFTRWSNRFSIHVAERSHLNIGQFHVTADVILSHAIDADHGHPNTVVSTCPGCVVGQEGHTGSNAPLRLS